MIDALNSISARPVGGVTSPARAAGADRRAPGEQPGSAFPGLADYGRPAPAGADAASAPARASAGAAPGGRTGEADAGGDSLRLSPEAQAQLRELRQRDAEVRAHEKAHMAAGGQYVAGGPSYEYQQGPDGRQYAIGGHVSIDASSVPDDPEASEAKARQVRRAALAPGEPSGQDRAVAAKAAAQEARAAREKQQEAAEDGAGSDGAATGVAHAEAGERDPATERASASEAGADAGAADPGSAAGAWGASRSGSYTDSESSAGHPHAVARAAETYAAMAQRGVMPTALAPGGTGISLQI